MKTTRTLALLMGLIATFVIVSCQKSKFPDFSESKLENTEAIITYQPAMRLENGSVLSGGVTLTAPQQVNIDETFNITAAVDCGKISIERGYILAADNITKIYKDLTCSPNLLWEELIQFQCYTDDASWNGSFDEPGNYVFRTKHNGSDGNCDGLGGSNTTGKCSFDGNQVCCFVIEAVDACVTLFEGQAVSCGTQREAVYTFTSKDEQTYFKIQGGLTNFTGIEDADVEVSGGTNIIETQGGPGGSTNHIIKVEGSIGACETITIRIKWNSTNSGGIITGSWSVKDDNGVELAPAVVGLTCN